MKTACPFCKTETILKQGFRKSKKRITQKYQCSDCKKYFTFQPKQQTSKTYPLKTILQSISNYNLGQPLRSQKIPKSTLPNWIKTLNLPMNRLRNQISSTPQHKIIIKQQFLHQRQPFLYQYHSLKLNFANRFPALINYLKSIHTIPQHIFENSQRISDRAKETTKEIPTNCGDRPGDAPSGVAGRTFSNGKWPSPAIGLVGISKSLINSKGPIDVVGISESKLNNSQSISKSSKSFSLNPKQNYAVEMAKLASAITENNKQRHQIIEDFMLINDSATIAAEIPVYLLPKNQNQKNLTGHIDILQIRFNNLFILDYKPEPVNQKQTIYQLRLYRLALSKRTNIPKELIHLAFFNDKGYYELLR